MTKRAVTFLALAILCSGACLAESLWTVQEIAEIDGFSVFKGVVAMKFKDAVSGVPVRGIRFEMGTAVFKGDEYGLVIFPLALVEDIDDEDRPFVVSAPGYVPLKDELQIRLGDVLVKRFVMTREIPLDQVRIVLEWERRPSDLDAHLVGPGFHISYRNMRSSSGNATLDRDAMQGFGPETITILGIRREARYEFSIENYSGEAPISGAKVSVYLDNRLDRVIRVPETRQKSVTIFTIVEKKVTYQVH